MTDTGGGAATSNNPTSGYGRESGYSFDAFGDRVDAYSTNTLDAAVSVSG